MCGEPVPRRQPGPGELFSGCLFNWAGVMLGSTGPQGSGPGPHGPWESIPSQGRARMIPNVCGCLSSSQRLEPG